MNSKFLPSVNLNAVSAAQSSENQELLYDMLVQPLHEEMYKRQTFDFMDELSWGQQLLLAYDYLYMQAAQGGFIQFIHNGYISLLPGLVEQLLQLGATEMAMVLDDALKVYVLNRDLLEAAESVEAFAKLYNELTEFEEIDERYRKLNVATTRQILAYANAHLDEFVTIEA
jgi:hypothetical protein